ncbi:MAG: response regulator [Burkholderiales bacterium]|nr:response regulator [Burkholderiales bacterium]
MTHNSTSSALPRLPSDKALSVLVVDDEKTNRMLMGKLVEHLGFEVTQASNGHEALLQLVRQAADIVLLDLLMPGMDGFEVARQIRTMAGLERTPIVVISALESMESIVQAIEAGADDYLIKPIRIPILAAKLGRLSEGLRAQKALLDEALRATAISETVSDALVIIDRSGLMEWVNPAAERTFGYAKGDLVGCNVSMLMPEPMQSEHDGYLARYLLTGEAKIIGSRRRTRGRHASGHVFPIELAVSPIKINGETAFLGMVRDMTEFEKLGHMKRDFISVINHELRTPLTSVVGSLSLLAAGAAGALPPKAQKLVEMAERNTARLGRLINDILDLDKIESNSLQLRLRRHSARQLLQEAVAVNEAGAQARQVELRLSFEVDDGDSLLLEADEDRFQQIMGNLLSNAIKFSPPNSPIQITARREAERLWVGVRDWGPGIPDAFRSRIFQRFSQAENPHTRTTEGSGLGLSIAKAIVEKMGGDIDFESVPMRGTLFFFYLPLIPVANLHTDGESPHAPT